MKKKHTFLYLSILVFLGFFQPISFELLAEVIKAPIYLWPFIIIALCLPAFPLMTSLRRYKKENSITPWVTYPLALFVIFLGGCLWFLGAVFGSSSNGLPLLTIHICLYTLAIAASCLYLSIERLGIIGKMITFCGMSIAAIGATWSILTIPILLVDANFKSHGAPMCIARHDGVKSDLFWGLRGFSLYTTASGYKSTSNWYFHGILIIEKDEGHQYYNWSPRRMRFDKIDHPQHMMVSLNTCKPPRRWWSK